MYNVPQDSLAGRLLPLQQGLAAGALPSPIVPFGEWLPDREALGNPGALDAKNVTPYSGGYRPFKAAADVSTNALDARSQGAAGARDKDGNVFIVAGDATKLYNLENMAWVDRSGATYNTANDGQWNFVQFGNKIIATNFDDAVQIMTLATGATFSNMITSTEKPKARYVAVANEFVVLGNINSTTDGAVPNRVHWSAINNETDFDPAANTQCDYQDLPTGGWVMAIEGSQKYFLVFTQTEIHRFSYVGGRRIFRRDVIDHERGTPIPGSVISYGRNVAFISEEGFFINDSNQSFPIGHDKVDKWFWDQFDPQYISRVSAAIDPVAKLIVWAFPGDGHTGEANRMIAWNWADKRWSHIDLSQEMLVRTLRNTGYTLDSLDSVGTDIDDASVFPFSFDSLAWTGGEARFGGISTSHKLIHYTGSNLAATFDTAEFQPNSQGLADLTGVFPIIGGQTSAMSTPPTCKLAARQRYADAMSFGSAVSQNSFGKCNFATNGQFFRARIDIDAGESWDEALGIRVQATEAGNP